MDKEKREFHTPQESMSLKQQMHRELGQNPLGPAQQTSKHPVLPREGEKNLQLSKQTKQKQHHRQQQILPSYILGRKWPILTNEKT